MYRRIIDSLSLKMSSSVEGFSYPTHMTNIIIMTASICKLSLRICYNYIYFIIHDHAIMKRHCCELFYIQIIDSIIAIPSPDNVFPYPTQLINGWLELSLTT